jgi:hypothetical protein
MAEDLPALRRVDIGRTDPYLLAAAQDGQGVAVD